MDLKFKYYITRSYNLFYILFLLLKNSSKYLYYKDSLKFIKDLTFDIEKFNYTYIKLFQAISCNSLMFNEKQKNFLLKYSNQVPFKESNHNLIYLSNLEEKYRNLSIVKDKPINSGIVALVYLGYLFNENNEKIKVVIKVLKNDVTDLLNSALYDVEYLTKILYYIPFINKFQIYKMFEFNQENIINQLDFKKELNNLKLWKNFSNKVDYLYIPYTYDKFTQDNSNLLVMEYVESTQLNRISLESKMLYCENLTKSIYIALFYYGLFHGDLHAGNVLFLENNKICLIDFGIACKIDKNEQNAIYNFYKNSLIVQNMENASLSITDLVYPKSILDNLNIKDKNIFYNKVKINIDKNFTEDSNIIKFITQLTKDLSEYNLTLSKGFSNTIYSVCAGINLNLELIQSTSQNPTKDYNNLCFRIIKELLSEFDFSLD